MAKTPQVEPSWAYTIAGIKREPERAACGCAIVGKNSDGKPLAACQVQGFRYYGGRCAADSE